jgi:hypothetical protein
MAQRLKPKTKQATSTEQSISLKGSTKIVTGMHLQRSLAIAC